MSSTFILKQRKNNKTMGKYYNNTVGIVCFYYTHSIFVPPHSGEWSSIMKKPIAFILAVILAVSLCITTYAGSIPQELGKIDEIPDFRYYSKDETISSELDVTKYSSITLTTTPILYLDDNIHIVYDHLKRSSVFNLSTKGNPENFSLGEIC